MKEIRQKNYMKFSNKQATLAAIIALPFIIAATIIAVVMYGKPFFEGQDNIMTIVVCMLNLIVCVPHELLHAAGFMAGGKKWSELEFGLNLPFSVFIRFHGEMEMKTFRIGLVMPFIFTALIPMMAGAVSGCFMLFITGVVQATACGSDLLSFLSSFNFKSNDTVVDIENGTGYAVL